MSLLTVNTKTATIKRQTKTKATDGNVTTTYTTAARLTLPTSLECRVMQPGARERLEYAQQDVEISNVLLFKTDPQVDNKDQITIDSDTMYVLSSVNPQRMSRLWIVTCVTSSRGVK